jgi:hypothetical protein
MRQHSVMISNAFQGQGSKSSSNLFYLVTPRREVYTGVEYA